MAIERRFHCDAPDCEANQGEMCRGVEPFGWLTLVEHIPPGATFHFCNINCVLKWAAKFDPPTIIPWNPDQKDDEE